MVVVTNMVVMHVVAIVLLNTISAVANLRKVL
jgi:hypothetical protein